MRANLATSLAAFCIMLVALATGPARAAEPAGFTVPDTQIVPFVTKDASRHYKLLIGLPHGYAAEKNVRHPVIYLLDADFSFPLAQTVLRHFNTRGQLTDAIIVGIAYPRADTDLDVYRFTRTRDYTPSFSAKGGYGPKFQKVSGGGDNFLNILANELLPYIDTHYRTVPQQRMIVGHSYGALFASYALLKRPGLFHDYLIVSPSYWYDDHVIFKTARSYVARHKALKARVFYAVGSFENHKRSPKMVDDVRAMDKMLTDAKLTGYESAVQVFDGDTHNSVFPAALTRGLRILYDYKGEAAGNALEKP